MGGRSISLTVLLSNAIIPVMFTAVMLSVIDKMKRRVNWNSFDTFVEHILKIWSSGKLLKFKLKDLG